MAAKPPLEALQAKVAMWETRFERLKASSARQLRELQDDNDRLRTRVQELEAVIEDAGLNPDELLAAMAGTKTSAPAPTGAVDAAADWLHASHSTAELLLATDAPLAVGEGLHAGHNVVSVEALGRVPGSSQLLIATGGADRTVALSLFDLADKKTITPRCAVFACPAPVLGLTRHPASLTAASPTTALVAVALMDGSLVVLEVVVGAGGVRGGAGTASAATTTAAAAVGTVTVKAVVTVRHHVKFLTRAKFSPDGALLATSSQDHHVILYNFTWTAGDGGTGVTVALDKVVDREFTGSTGKFGAGIRHWLRASRPCENLCIVLELCTVC